MSSSKSKTPLFFIYALFSLFIISSFMKMKGTWGINFLYYQPLWMKLAIIIPGIAICINPVNSLVSTYAQSIMLRGRALHHTLKQDWKIRWTAAALMAVLIAALLYVFRVVPLYHDSILAIYFLERDVSFYDYILDTTYGLNKPGLFLFNGFVRFLFQSIFTTTPFWTLAYTSIFLGILYFILLYKTISELTGSTFPRVFIFIMLSTQAISFYFFGYGNSYTVIPVLVLLYIYFLIRYFKGKTRLVSLGFIGLAAITTHFGTIPIAASFVYVLVYRFRERFSRIFEIMSFARPLRTLAGMFIVFGIPYIIIAEGIIEVPYFSYAFVPVVSEPKLGYGWNILSTGYLLHLVNVLLLLSPMGIILFLHTVKRITGLGSGRECVIALVWFAIGGFSILLLTTPQTLYAWDIYAWLSTGYVLLGSYLFSHTGDGRGFSYRTTLIATHSLLYFAAWLALNNNVYAAVLNFIDAVPERFENQIPVTLEAVNNDVRDEDMFTLLVSELETRAQSKDDFKWILHSYETVKDTANSLRVADRLADLYFEAIRENPDVAYNYYDLYTTLPESEVFDPTKREHIEPYLKTPVELEPENITYLAHYGMYLAAMGDNQNAHTIMKRADSLYTHKNISRFDTGFRHVEFKGFLALTSYGNNSFLDCVKYFDEYIRLKPRHDSDIHKRVMHAAIISYAELGNRDMAMQVMKQYKVDGIDPDVIKSLSDAGKILRTRILFELVNDGGVAEAEEILHYATRNTFVPEYEIFRCLLNLHDGAYVKLRECASNIVRHDENFPAAHLLRGIALLHEKDISAATAELEMEKMRMTGKNTCTWVDYVVLSYCDSYVEKWAMRRDIPRDVASLLNELSLSSLSTGDSPFARSLSSIHSLIVALKTQNVGDLLSHSRSAGTAVLETVHRLVNCEVQVGHFIYQNAQNAIIEDRSDSLNIYADLMLDFIPDHFQGYFLKGVSLKKANKLDSAKIYFQQALDRLPNSSLLANPGATRQRIESIMNSDE